MGKVYISTNYHKREILGFWQLTEKQQAQVLDQYSGVGDMETVREEWQFFVYKGDVYSPNDMEHWGNAWSGPRPQWAKGWSFFLAQAFYFGIIGKYVQDDDNYGEWCIVVGSFVCT